VSLDVHGESLKFRGTVTIVSADNPASASLGGFKQSASAFRFCRHCTGTMEDIQSKVWPSPCVRVYVYICRCLRHYNCMRCNLGNILA